LVNASWRKSAVFVKKNFQSKEGPSSRCTRDFFMY
jgi:hypothetical protein